MASIRCALICVAPRSHCRAAVMRDVQVGAQAPQVRQLQVDDGRGGQDARPDARAREPGAGRQSTVRQHVDGRQLMHGLDPPDAELPFLGDLQGTLECRPGGVEITRALAPPEDVQRLKRYLCRPALEAASAAAASARFASFSARSSSPVTSA